MDEIKKPVRATKDLTGIDDAHGEPLLRMEHVRKKDAFVDAKATKSIRDEVIAALNGYGEAKAENEKLTEQVDKFVCDETLLQKMCGENEKLRGQRVKLQLAIEQATPRIGQICVHDEASRVRRNCAVEFLDAAIADCKEASDG